MRILLQMVLATLVVAPAFAQVGNLLDSNLYTEPVVEGLVQPTSFEFVNNNTILALQKGNGKVQVVTGGQVTGTALDLAVANQGEMGLLGICKHPNFEANNLVFIYYTAAASDGGAWIEDRVETFSWNPLNRSLTYVRRILTFGPEGFPFGQYHHGGYIKIGADNKLYVLHGDMFSRQDTIEINDDSGISGNNASIYRVNLDGSTPVDNPFANHPIANLRKVYVYGLRNAFGMSFDPKTGRLWYTENGPELYDEINHALPGMNSGWHKIMGPANRHSLLEYNNGIAYSEKDLVMLPGAHYSDPEFSFKTPVGITFIEFLASRKFPAQYHDRVLVGCTSLSMIFMLQLNAQRNGFLLEGTLADGVADSIREAESIAIGTGWGVLVDGRIGPDGYFYLSRLGSGAIVRIRPVNEQVQPESHTVVRGTTTGTLQQVLDSDDIRFVVKPGIIFTTGQPPAELEFTGRSPFGQPDELSFTAELQGTSPTIKGTLWLFNYSKNEYDEMSNFSLKVTDTEVATTVKGLPADYVHQLLGTVKAKLAFRASGPAFVYPWEARIDKVSWSARRPSSK